MSIESWAQALTAILPLLAGGLLLKFFKEWAYTEREMSEKLLQARKSISERLAEAHTDLLEKFNLGTPLRGKPPHTPDPAGRYSEALRKKMTILFRYEATGVLSQAGHSVLFMTWLGSLVMLIGGILAAVNKAAAWCERVFFLAIVLAALQGLIVCWLRGLKKQVDQLGDTI